MELDYPEAEFNSGLALIFQLDAIEKGMIHATINSDYKLHYRMLVAYFKTLCNQASDKEEAEQLKIWDLVRNNHKKIGELKAKGHKKIPSYLLESFDYWEIQLRNLKQKHGLGMPKRDPRYSGTKR